MTTAPGKAAVLVEHRTPSRRGARVLMGAVRAYQLVVSPALAPSCRYLPSCSEYTLEALEVHGAARGSWLALRRLLRCHPFHAGGHDPVPPRVARGSAVTASPLAGPRLVSTTGTKE